MAEVGSEQLRYKPENQLVKEHVTLQRELTRLIQEQADAQREYARLDKTLLDDLNKEYEEIQRIGAARIANEEDIRKVQEDIVKTTSLSYEGRLQTVLKYLFHLEKSLDTEQNIAKLKTQIISDDLAAAKKKHEEEEQSFENLQQFLGKFGNLFNLQHKYYSGLKKSNIIKKEHLVLTASVLAVLEETFVLFKQMDDALAKFRIEFGMLRTDAAQITTRIKEVAMQFAAVGVTTEVAAEAVKALGLEFGGTARISQDLIETTALLKAQLGVAEDISAGFLRNISALSKSTAQTQRHMAFVAHGLASAYGIPLNLVMQDIAKMSGTALALISRMPMQMVKTAVEARKLGTSINKMADASSQLLNFTENVQAEMEASVLIGESVNLQLARELAYRRNIVGSTKAILAEARRLNFEQMDYFQMQAFAAATGRSAEELLKMVQAQRQLREARGIDALKDEVALIDKIEGMRQSELEDRAFQTELTVKQQANQARLAALQQQWNQLLMETMRVMYPLFDIILKVSIVAVKIGPPLLFALVTINKFTGVLTKMADIWVNTNKYIVASALGVNKFAGGVAKIFVAVKSVLSHFSKLSALLSGLKFVAPFLKAVPVIGWVITALQLVVNLMKHFKGIGEVFKTQGWGAALKFGVAAIGKALYDTLLRPFVDVYNWIMKHLGGHSASEIGISIVKGIAAVTSLIFDELTSPFRKFFAWVLEKLPGMGGIADKIRGGMRGAYEDAGLLEKKMVARPIPATITTESVPLSKTSVITVPTTDQQTQNEQNTTTLADILKSLKTLNDNLISGKVAVYIDGQLASSLIARSSAFGSGYGMNQARV